MRGDGLGCRRCGGAMRPQANRRCERTGEVWNAFECDGCGRRFERRARRSRLYWAGQPTAALAESALDGPSAAAAAGGARR